MAKIVFSTKISDLYGYNSGNPVSLQERFWLFGVPLSLYRERELLAEENPKDLLLKISSKIEDEIICRTEG